MREREKGEERESEKDLLSASSLTQMVQAAGVILSQAEARNSILLSHMVAGAQVIGLLATTLSGTLAGAGLEAGKYKPYGQRLWYWHYRSRNTENLAKMQ